MAQAGEEEAEASRIMLLLFIYVVIIYHSYNAHADTSNKEGPRMTFGRQCYLHLYRIRVLPWEHCVYKNRTKWSVAQVILRLYSNRTEWSVAQVILRLYSNRTEWCVAQVMLRLASPLV